MRTIAQLDAQNRYVGKKEVADDAVGGGDVDITDGCDLPANGSYRWNGSYFVPVGHPLDSGPPELVETVRGPSALPQDRYVLWLALRAMVRGGPFPEEVHRWVDVFERTMVPDLEARQATIDSQRRRRS